MDKRIKNKRAFTLAELLIVVIVIGVMSAIAFPRFNQIIENRKVTEAEEMMSAVRTEQERRCAMDQKYTLEMESLSDIISSGKTKDYNYSLQAEGISAQSNTEDYTIKMLSYQDGSFCCTGEDCSKLNKNYPKCEGLTFPPSGCEGTDESTGDVGAEPEPTPEPSCEGEQPADQVKNCECGTVKASYTCSAATNYKWVLGEFPACPAKPANITETCADGATKRTKAYACVNGAWTLGNWDKECPTCDNSKKIFCLQPQAENQNGKAGTWDDATCTCTCPAGTQLIDGMCLEPLSCDMISAEEKQKCVQPQDPYSKAGTWNRYTCRCDCPEGTELNTEGECSTGLTDEKGYWSQAGMEYIGGFLCDQAAEANEFCKYNSNPSKAPEGECIVGAPDILVGCYINDGCPARGIDIEADRYECRK